MDSITSASLVQDQAEHSSSKPTNNEPKRKRSIVPLACLACRRRKTKCDGRRPTCLPCEHRHIECTYDFPDDIPAAQRGKRVNERLSQRNVDLRAIFESLRDGDDAHAMAVLQEIRTAESLERSLETILASITLQSRSHSIIQQTTGLPFQSSQVPADHSPSSPNSEKQPFANKRPLTDVSNDGILKRTPSYESDPSTGDTQIEIDVLPLSKWTSVVGTDEQYSKLLTLLWTWDTAFIGIIYRPSFEKDLRSGAHSAVRNSAGRHFCSTFLVNALLGFACTYTTDESRFANMSDPFSRGRLFVEQAEQELQQKKTTPSFDLLQGLVMLFAYEARLGDAVKAKLHLALTFEIYDKLDFTQSEVASEMEESDLEKTEVLRAKSKIAWGLYVFEWRLSYTYGVRKRLSRPKIPKSWQFETSNIDEPQGHGYWWFPYPRTLSRRRSYVKELFNAECQLIEIAETILEFVYPQDANRVISFDSTKTRALSLLKVLTEWKIWFSDTIPEAALDLPLALHICYSYEMLTVLVLRKVLHLSRSEFGSTSASPQSLCHMHTNAIANILWTYRATYTIHYEFWAIQACALIAFSTIFNLAQNTTLLDSFEKACIILAEISRVYPVAADFLYAIRTLVDRNDIQVSAIAKSHLNSVDGPRQKALSEMWRAPIVLGRDLEHGMKGGIRDVVLGDIL